LGCAKGSHARIDLAVGADAARQSRRDRRGTLADEAMHLVEHRTRMAVG
jgi:hypothetical protein